MSVRIHSLQWAVLGVVSLVVLTAVEAQQPPTLALRVRETTPVTGQGVAGFIHPIKCDSRGNLYVRFTDSVGGYMASPVTKISPDGKVQAVFRIEAAPGFQNGSTFDDFAVDPRGKVYLLTQKDAPPENQDDASAGEQLIVTYDADGEYNSTVKLEALFGVAHLAVFTSGEFFASGERVVIADSSPRESSELLTAIFDRRGRIAKELSLSDDIEREQQEGESASTGKEEPSASQAAGGSRPEANAKLSADNFSKALSMGTAVSADDGNIYLMRATHHPLVHVISSGGTVIRRLQITAPVEHSHPVSLQVAGGKMAILFVETYETRKFKGHIAVVANAETGETLADYPISPELGGGLACYTPDGFTFVGTKEGQLVIRTTYPY